MADRYGVTMEGVLEVNPFTDRYLEEEVEFYGLEEPYSRDGVEVRMLEPVGRLDDYLNKNWHIDPGFQVPGIFVDGELWMSLTWMEVQSLFTPISQAGGVVGTAGLGLGYFPLRIAGLDDVERVEVFEREPRVVDFFEERFSHRPEFGKISVTVGDARKEMLWNERTRRSFDYVFMDVYQTLLPDEVIDDIHLFLRKASVEVYRFWGQEKVVLDALMGGLRPEMSFFERAFFRTWDKTPVEGEDATLGELYEPLTDRPYQKAALAPLGYWGYREEDEE
jgi:hypothetical protein